MKTFIHTVHLLQKTVDLKRLPVADILLRLLETEGGPGQPTAILGTKHVLCWGFEELLNHTTEEPADKEKDKGTGSILTRVLLGLGDVSIVDCTHCLGVMK